MLGLAAASLGPVYHHIREGSRRPQTMLAITTSRSGLSATSITPTATPGVLAVYHVCIMYTGTSDVYCRRTSRST